jgi:transcriptional regulator with XRE-family HTH domain
MLQKRLGQRIADLRKTGRLTQAQFARAVGCSVEFISLVERGVNAPSVARLEDYAKALAVEVVDLFTFAGRKPTQIKRRHVHTRARAAARAASGSH